MGSKVWLPYCDLVTLLRLYSEGGTLLSRLRNDLLTTILSVLRECLLSSEISTYYLADIKYIQCSINNVLLSHNDLFHSSSETHIQLKQLQSMAEILNGAITQIRECHLRYRSSCCKEIPLLYNHITMAYQQPFGISSVQELCGFDSKLIQFIADSYEGQTQMRLSSLVTKVFQYFSKSITMIFNMFERSVPVYSENSESDINVSLRAIENEIGTVVCKLLSFPCVSNNFTEVRYFSFYYSFARKNDLLVSSTATNSAVLTYF